MKKIILYVLLVPILSFGQSSNWRSTPRSNGGGGNFRSTGPSPNYSSPNTSTWRSNPPSAPRYNYTPEIPRPNHYGENHQYYYNHPRYYGGYPYNYNNWYNWGAPMYDYNYYMPGYYYDRWGYREPYRVYDYKNGIVDTIRGQKTHFSFGIQMSLNEQLGGFITVGNRAYFIAEYNQTYKRDNSTYFPYGTVAKADFPITGEVTKLNTFYMGVGKKIGRTGVHILLGTSHEVVRYKGGDSIGYITFPKYTNDLITAKIGALHDFKNATVKLDYDPVLKTIYMGMGINF